MTYANPSNPSMLCRICNKPLDSAKVKHALENIGKWTIVCECGEIWGIDNFPDVKLIREEKSQ